MARRQPSERVAQLRAQASRLEKNATSKASRLTARGADIRGTAFDPRKGSKAIGRMNSSQLEAHINRLQSFTARTTRFVGTAEGPVGGKVANDYFAAVRRRNSLVSQNIAKYGDLKPPHSAETLRQAYAKTDAAQRRMANPTSENPFRKLDSTGVVYKSEASLSKVIDTINKGTRRQLSGEATEAKVGELKHLLSTISMPAFEQFIDNMSQEALALMVSDRRVFDDLVSDYSLVLSGLSTSNAAFQDAIDEHEMRALEIAEWATKETMGRRL